MSHQVLVNTADTAQRGDILLHVPSATTGTSKQKNPATPAKGRCARSMCLILSARLAQILSSRRQGGGWSSKKAKKEQEEDTTYSTYVGRVVKTRRDYFPGDPSSWLLRVQFNPQTVRLDSSGLEMARGVQPVIWSFCL
jgi:hypothetical protein